ncbi:CAZyme family GH71 [Aspergillus niger]|nr:CAZyme family GH71 [Aspergillus niger]
MVNIIWLALVLVALSIHVQAKDVFAHFILANAENFTQTHWTRDISAAKAAQIDAFALNTGYGAANTDQLLTDALTVAAAHDFKLFLSLDYSGDGHWPPDQVLKVLQGYANHTAYYRVDNKHPLVSTFEGYEALSDWSTIKEKLPDIYFMPEWSVRTPQELASEDVVDGLLSWSAWPYGTTPMNTSTDEQYISALKAKDKPYIMPVSPWFYTDMVRYHKNWVWQGDGLWHTRWKQVLDLQPQFVEILTWNDFGESHYVGPLHENELGIFAFGQAPFNYASGMVHDAWREFLPYVVGEYKNGSGKGVIDKEGVVVWYRVTPAWACKAGLTTGNSVTQGQQTMPPGQVLKDEVFFQALLEDTADVEVSIGGGENESVGWTDTPSGGSSGGGRGLYFGSVPMDNRTGEVVVTLSRNGKFVAQMIGEKITTQCPDKLTNWNAWVGTAMSNVSNASTSRASLSEENGAAGVRVGGGRGMDMWMGVLWMIVVIGISGVLL